MASQRIELPPDVASCSKARRFVGEALAQADDDLRVSASLLASEVVTNALLHAPDRSRSKSTRRAPHTGSPWVMKARHPRPKRAIGQTMPLAVVSRSWTNWRPRGVGNGLTPARSSGLISRCPSTAHRPHVPNANIYDDPYPNGTPIALLGAPVQEMIRTGAHYDALYREFRLILELDLSRRQAVPGRLLSLIDQLGTTFLGYGRTAVGEWETAVSENRANVDVHFRFPATFGPAVEWYNQLLDEADDYCQRAELLTIAPTDEALAVRRWAFGQVARQCHGEPPTPWDSTASRP